MILSTWLVLVFPLHPYGFASAVLALTLFGIQFRHHCADRHDPANRRRNEERDPDDRLRAAGATRRRNGAPKGDLPCRHSMILSNHDDDDRGIARSAGVMFLLRRRERAAPTAWRSYRGRANLWSGADVVHHSNCLSASESPAIAYLARGACGSAVTLRWRKYVHIRLFKP